MTGKSKPGMKFHQLIRKETRNWTHLETEIFCNMLVESEFNYCHSLETKALKKSSNEEVFETLQQKFCTTIFQKIDFFARNM